MPVGHTRPMEPREACARCQAVLPAAPVVERGRRYCCPGCATADLLYGGTARGDTEGPAGRLRAVREAAGPAARVALDLEGLRCTACCWLIERELAALPGVVAARASFALDRAVVDYDPLRIGPEELVRRVEALGYGASVHRPAAAPAHGRQGRDLLLRLGVAFLFSMAAMEYRLLLFAAGTAGAGAAALDLGRLLALLAAPVQAWAGLPLYRGAWRGLVRGVIGADFLIATGTWASYGYSLAALLRHSAQVYFEGGAMVIAFVLLGRLLEQRARARAAAAADGVLALAPRKALLVSGEGLRPVPAADVRPGERVLVPPGEPVPVDGRVVRGESWVEEAMFTGEPQPVPKAPGAPAWAGSRNGAGELVVVTACAGPATVLGRLAAHVERASRSAGATERLSDRAARAFAPAVALLATLSALAWWAAGQPGRAVTAAAGVLVVACPCALGLAVPLAAAIAVGRAALAGAVVKGAEVLERAAGVDTVVFDKTGTLTRGQPALAGVVLDEAAGCREEEFLAQVAAAEAGSDHPLATGVRAEAQRRGQQVPPAADATPYAGLGVAATVGGRRVFVGTRGLAARAGLALPPALERQAREREARGETVVFAGWEGRVRGLLSFLDPCREDAPAAVAGLRARGIAVLLMTGDAEGAAAAVARACGIASFQAGLGPEDKAREVARLRAAGRRVAFVGDGSNDAPALAAADVGVAVGSGTQLAVEAAGIVVTAPGVAGAVRALALARAAATVMRQNLLWAFAYNALALPVAAAGLLRPELAAAAMALSSLSVTLNSLRLRRHGAGAGGR